MQQQRKKTSAGAKPWEKKKEDDDAEPMAAATAAATRKRSKSDARKYDTNVNQYKRQAGQVVREHKRRHPLPPSSSEKKNLPEQEEEEEEEQMEEEGEIDSIDEILDVDNFHAVEPLENAEQQQQQPKLTMAEFMNMDPVEQQRRLVQDRVGRDAERLALLQKDAAFQGSAALYKTVGERFWEDEPEKEEEEEGVPVDGEEEGMEVEEEQYDNDRGRGLNRMSTRTFIELAQDKLNAEPQNDALRNVIDHAQRGLYKPGRTDGWGPNCIIPHLHHAGQYEMARDVQNNLFDFSK